MLLSELHDTAIHGMITSFLSGLSPFALILGSRFHLSLLSFRQIFNLTSYDIRELALVSATITN